MTGAKNSGLVRGTKLVGMIIALLICHCSPVLADDAPRTLKLDGKTSRYDLQGYLEIYEDKTGKETFDSVQQSDFSAARHISPNLGFTGSAYWLRLSVENATPEPQKLFFQVKNRFLDFVDIVISSDQSAGIERYRDGARVPWHGTVSLWHTPVVELNFAPGETKTAFVRVKSDTPLRVPVILCSAQGRDRDERKHDLVLGCFYGVLGFIIVYSLFGWSIFKQKSYLYYILFLIAIGINQLANDGLIPRVTIFSRPEKLLHLLVSVIGFALILGTLFVSSFMEARTKYPRIYRVLDLLVILGAAITIVYQFNYYLANIFIQVYAPVFTLVLTVIVGYMWYKGEAYARYLFLAEIQYPGLLAVNAAVNAGLIPFDLVMNPAVKVAVLWQGMFYSLALADRYSIIQRNFQLELEDKVAERSAELVQTNANLQLEIKERMRVEEAIVGAKREWEETFDTVPDLIAIIDGNHKILRVNKAMAEKMLVHPRDAIGKSCHKFCHGTSAPIPSCPLDASIADGVEHAAEVAEPKLGGVFLVSVTPLQNDEPGTRRFVHVARDITERKILEERLRTLATTDGLTNIWNRRQFMHLADREFDRTKRYGGQLALMMIDLDHFKVINDTYGHDVGDEALKKVAEIGSTTLRKVDIFARYGGEEFAIVLPESGLEQALNVAERLRRSVEETQITANNTPVQTTISIGLTVAHPEIADLVTVLKQADEALYQAKNRGRNRVEIFQGVLPHGADEPHMP